MPTKKSSPKRPEFFHLMLDSMSFGGLLVDIDRKIKYCNYNIKNIFGYSPDEIIGKNTGILYKDRRQNPATKREIYNALENNGFHIGAAQGKTKDGKEINLQLSTFLIKPNEGAIILVQKMADVISQIDKTNFLQNLLDTIPDMIYFKDKNNKFVLVNKAHAEALKMSQEELIGKSDKDVFPGALGDKYFEDDNKVIKTGQPIIGKIEVAPRHDGGKTYVSTTKMPQFDGKGNIIGNIGITRNITDKMIAEEELRSYKDKLENMVKERTSELEESNERLKKMYNVKSEFTSMVSHELRTPLTIIKESMSIVADETLGPLNQKQKAHLKLTLESLNRFERLINDVLDFSKLENKKMRFHLIQADINQILNQVITSYRPTAEKKGLKLTSRLDHSLALINIDPDRIIQVLHNLLSNAVKFTQKGGIHVESYMKGGNITVSVGDTGIGITQNDMPRIFEKFEQVANPKIQAHRRGTGLGLAICKQIIDQMGGRIWVESTPEKGSTFYFDLPLKPINL